MLPRSQPTDQWNKAIVVHSGGLDSTVLLYFLIHQGFSVKSLSIDYGQRHKKELHYAQAICSALDVEHRIADVSGISSLLQGNSLTSSEIAVPEGHYTEENMKLTVVPNRNMILLSVAVGWGVSEKAHFVAYAAHSGDHTIYPDCREEFASALNSAIKLCDWHPIELYRPFVHKTKGDLVTLGTQLGLPFEKTWSCYKGGALHCGVCGTCVERREAFHLAGLPDPTGYERK